MVSDISLYLIRFSPYTHTYIQNMRPLSSHSKAFHIAEKRHHSHSLFIHAHSNFLDANNKVNNTFTIFHFACVYLQIDKNALYSATC